MRHASKLTAVWLLLLASPCDAIEPSAESETELELEGVVVTGAREESLRHFAEALSQSGPTGQLARWQRVICPQVLGIAPEQAQWIADRIVEIAESVGLRRASARCLPTMRIIITPDAAGFAAQLAGRHAITLRRDGASQLKRFVTSERPVRWIALTEPCAYGCPLPNSRLAFSTKPTLTQIVIVVEATRLGGYAIGEIADHVALIGLVNPPLKRQPPPDSILSMFEKAEPAGAKYELTRHDRAFLQALYGIDLDQSARSQQRSIGRRMDVILEKDPDAAKSPE